MTLPDLMDALYAHSATLTVAGDGLTVRAPAALPDAVMAALHAHKAEILAVWQDVRSSRDDLAGGTSEAAPDRPASAPERWAIFDREQVAEVAFHEHRAAGFPYRRLSVSRCMLAINKLAATPTEKLLETQTAYQVPIPTIPTVTTLGRMANARRSRPFVMTSCSGAPSRSSSTASVL